ncbi:MAG: hypothetical protein R3B84_21600 [Zavarzinella sp.]
MTSNSFASEALSRLPLAEAAFLMLDDIFQNNTLEAIYQSNRGRTYTRILTFSSFFQLLRDSLISPDHSARARLIDASENGELPTSLKAFYDKLAYAARGWGGAPFAFLSGYFKAFAKKNDF